MAYRPEVVRVRLISVQTERVSCVIVITFQSAFDVTLRSRVKVSDSDVRHKSSSCSVLCYLQH